MSTATKTQIIDPTELGEFCKRLKASGKTIATLNGSFDLLHAGHLYMLQEAKAAADCLIVALNSDASIQQYKSPKRPIITLNDRMALLSAIRYVDYVTWFEETTPNATLATIQPDVHVNGEEYGENCIEAEVVKKYGGQIKLVPRIEGLSTTKIIQKIQSL